MMQRPHGLAGFGGVILALATLSGCRSTGQGLDLFSTNRGLKDIVARGAEPDPPTEELVPVSVPWAPEPAEAAGAQEPATQSAPAITFPATPEPSDPFAPLSTEEILATSGLHLANPSIQSAVLGAESSPAPSRNIQATWNIPNSAPSPMSSSLIGVRQAPSIAAMPHSALHQCPSCGGRSWIGGQGDVGPDGLYTSMVDNMVIFGGADYFTSAGAINPVAVQAAASSVNVTLAGPIADVSPYRAGGYVGANAAAPLTPGGNLGFQIGFEYDQVELGGQGFFTTGVFHRCDPRGGLSLNAGVVYDLLYDDLHSHHVGQIRFQIGTAFSARNELGAWFNVVTNRDQTDVPILTLSGVNGLTVDSIAVDFKPISQGHLFWRHIMPNGAESMVFAGVRDSPSAFLIGGTAHWPVSDHWALTAGGHWSDDQETYNVYSGIALYPGGRARTPSACGCRYLPYMDVANNTFLTVDAKPVSISFEDIGIVPL